MIRKPYRPMPALGPRKLGPRERILAQFRGVDVSTLVKTREMRARPAADFMPKILGDLRIDRRQAEAEIVRVWNNLLDPAITAHAQPTGIRNGTLFVSVDSNVWHAEIMRYRRKEILDRLQHSFGRDLIQRLSLRIG